MIKIFRTRRSIVIIAVLLAPPVVAQDIDEPEPRQELLEGVAEGDEPDATVEEFIEEIREESRARAEESEAESGAETQVLLIPAPTCGTLPVVAGIIRPCERATEQP